MPVKLSRPERPPCNREAAGSSPAAGSTARVAYNSGMPLPFAPPPAVAATLAELVRRGFVAPDANLVDGKIVVSTSNARCTATATFVRRKGGYEQAKTGNRLIIDGRPFPIADSLSELRQIFDDPDAYRLAVAKAVGSGVTATKAKPAQRRR